ncbi:MAG: CoA transferase [Anaerolineaceae bacterium]
MTAFGGLRVLDFSEGISGPMAAMLIGDFGAEVVKIEGAARDRLAEHPGYLCWNRNKKRLKLDLSSFEGLHAARELLRTADLAIFDSSPGKLERLGLDATTLLAANPSLVHAWLPPYSVAGRWSQLPPDSMLLSAISAVASQQSSYEDRPVSLETPQLAYSQAMDAAGAIGSALVNRARTGRGEALVVSGLHAVAAVTCGTQTRFGDVIAPARRGSRGGLVNYRLYQCSDGEWLFLGTLTPAFFFRAIDVMGLMDLIMLDGVDGEYTKLLLPPNDQVAIEWLDRRFAERPRVEWLGMFKDAGVPSGPVGDRESWFRSETVAANQMLLEMVHPEFGRVELPGLPVKLSATPGAVQRFMEDTTLEQLAPHAPLLPAYPVKPQGVGPLAGIRVLDLGAFIAGAFAPTILASYGADVIKVEPLDGDPFRIAGLQFVGHNRGKRGLAIDLKTVEGKEAFFDLVRVSDVVLDNYRIGVRERLGIDYEALRKENPRIISCSVSGYGPVGPLASDPGFDPLLQARSGMMAAQGGDGEPVFYTVAVNDSASAMMAAFGIVAALHARERTGRGQDVVTCLANQSILCQSGELTWYEGRPANAPGARDRLGSAAIQRFYECSDGWLAISCTTAEQFPQLCIALGHPEWAGRIIAERASREPVEGPLASQIADVLRGMSREEALDRLAARSVPAAHALRPVEWFSDAFAAENHCFDTYDHPQFGSVSGPHAFARFTSAGGEFVRRSPVLGEHSAEVLRDFGFAAERVDDLIARGIVLQAAEQGASNAATLLI